MKEYVALGFNHLIAIDGEDGTLKPRVEIIVICSEPSYAVDAGGLRTLRTLTDQRFFTGPDTLRQIAAALVEQANILDRIHTDQPGFRFRMKPDDDSGTTRP